MMLLFCLLPQTAFSKSASNNVVQNEPVTSSNIIEDIKVRGNDRIETSTVLSYMVVQPGDSFNRTNLNRSLKTLYATGLFRDVSLEREGSALVVTVAENAVVNRIVFEGNSAIKDEDITKEVTLRTKAVYSARAIAADRQRILNLYASKARYGATVTPQIIKLSHNRVDVIFKINEAHETKVRKVVFVGNKFYTQAALSAVVSSKEDAWYRIFSSSTQYNPDRVKYDGELLRRFYLHNGFIDYHLVDSTGELSTDHQSFYITYTVHEGERYRLSKLNIRSTITGVTPKMMQSHMVSLIRGAFYDATAVQDVATSMQEWLQGHGYPFTVVRSEIARNPEKRTVDLLFDIVEGPRTYVERIDINGNTITRDSIVRRNLPVAEGDAFTPLEKKYSKYAIQDLGYFKDVSVSQTPGSAPDKINLIAHVQEKPTGQFSVGGGYSTDAGVMGNVAVKQTNLLGSGVSAGFNGTIAYYERQADLSVTDPYFLGRNMVAGADVYFTQSLDETYQSYNEGRYGFDLRTGYSISRYLSQSWTYSLVDRDIGNVNLRQAMSGASSGYNDQYVSSAYIIDSRGWSLLSQLSTSLTYDRRDSRSAPHSGYVVTIGGDFAGIGGDEEYMRGKINGAYYFPLDKFTGNHDWVISLKGGFGYMGNWGDADSDRRVIDNFYLGGQNLRGFLQGGVGPRSAHINCGPDRNPNGPPCTPNWEGQEDMLGGRLMYTASFQINYPVPMGKSLGISARSFIDIGGLGGVRVEHLYTSPGDMCHSDPSLSCYTPIEGNTFAPRATIGEGISWKSPFGLVNIDAAIPFEKQPGDITYPFRFGFGQQF
ncbi:outer membrane protein assembly factor BamA [Acetobacteraceae bacterium]|nr:outer membrane protein assembly factor BamA [Acetobacteraceae bacterium]